MKELANSPDLRKSGSIVEVDHKVRGKYLTIGSLSCTQLRQFNKYKALICTSFKALLVSAFFIA